MKVFKERMIPEKSFYSNIRKVLQQEEWDILRKAVYKKEGYKCHICGAANIRLEVHEKWLYDYDNSVQKLQEINALCRMCHLNNHLGFAAIQIVEKKLDKNDLIMHWYKINNETVENFKEYEEMMWRLWDLRNTFDWIIVDHNGNEISMDVKLYDLLKLVARDYERNDNIKNEKPSEVIWSYWIFAHRKKGSYLGHTKRSGKWLIFAPISEIDEHWEVIKTATENGLLGSKSKVSTAKLNPNDFDPNIKVICVFSYDSDDVEDVMRIREELRKLGITKKIPYKTDKATDKGEYLVRGGEKISKYYE